MSSERSERDRKLDELARRYRERLARQWPEGDADITQIEERVGRVERETLREITEEMVREQTGKRQGNQTSCPCGATALYRKQASITLVTAYGRIRAERAYFYCASCRDGHCPQDAAWGIGLGHATPTVQDLVGYLAAFGSYVSVPGALRRVRPAVHLGTKTIELIAQRLGERVEQNPPAGPACSGRPIAVGVDGVMLPTRAGQKETRCGAIYEPEWNPARTKAAEAELRKEYLATLTSREHFMAAVCARVAARRPHAGRLVAALGDGAKWIWTGYAAHLPNRVEILDFFHAAEHLGEVAAAWHGEGTQQASEWVKQQKKKLLRYGPGPLLRALRKWQPEKEAAAEVKRQELGYFENNQHRMDYPRYLALGLPIGSGAVEGACKHLVADRFKGAGMRWNEATAEPLLHLRAALLTHPDLDLRPYAAMPA